MTSVACDDLGAIRQADAAAAATRESAEKSLGFLPHSTCFDGVLCAAVTTQAHTVAGVVGGGTAAAAGGAAAAGTTAATGAATSAGLHSNASSSGAAGSGMMGTVSDDDSDWSADSDSVGANGVSVMSDRAELYIGTFHGAVLGYHAVERWIPEPEPEPEPEHEQSATASVQQSNPAKKKRRRSRRRWRCRLEVSLRSVTNVSSGAGAGAGAGAQPEPEPVVALRVLDVFGDGVDEVVATTRYGISVMQRNPVAVDAAMRAVLSRLGSKIQSIESSPRAAAAAKAAAKAVVALGETDNHNANDGRRRVKRRNDQARLQALRGNAQARAAQAAAEGLSVNQQRAEGGGDGRGGQQDRTPPRLSRGGRRQFLLQSVQSV